MSQLFIFTDGGARGNPGPAACAFIAKDSQNQIVNISSKVLGIATNNIAEYQGVIEALNWLVGLLAKKEPIPDSIIFFLDSQLVVNQLQGNFKTKEIHLKNLLAQVKFLEQKLKMNISYHHIPRAENHLADFHLNRALDASL